MRSKQLFNMDVTQEDLQVYLYEALTVLSCVIINRTPAPGSLLEKLVHFYVVLTYLEGSCQAHCC